MADQVHRHITQLQLLQQGVGVGGELSETVLVALGLAGFAEAHLVRCDHPVARGQQRGDGLLPGGRAEVLAVQQHHHPDGPSFGQDIQP
ncbi:hypothetical protein G6F68_020243 [Rhizopus microsporus]|nr:hypothetical protein G6F68_020243 [Rhizopus microsporus]